jgi:hypothetical protein
MIRTARGRGVETTATPVHEEGPAMSKLVLSILSIVFIAAPGGAFAQAAARALVEYTEMPMAEVAEQALKIAAEICVYTNDQIIVETLT